MATLRMVLKGLASPLDFCLALIVLAFVLSRRPRLSRALYLSAGAILLILSTPAISDALLQPVEQQYPQPKLADVPPSGAIVVLGGFLHLPGGRHPDIELAAAGDRLRCAASLFHAGKAPLILISGGSAGPLSESQGARTLLMEWGVPAGAILTEDAARATNENALLTRELLRQRGIGSAILVTSAAHMPRAVAAFRKAGLPVVPVAADFQTGWAARPFILDWLPTAEAFENSTVAIRELAGMAFYRVMGWA